MSLNFDDVLAKAESGDLSAAQTAAEEMVSRAMTSFMEELTVNTATDYVASVLLYAGICQGMKKPWKAMKKMDAANGALRFLDDYMSDRDTLSQTYRSVALAYEAAGFLPEAASFYVKEALSLSDQEGILDSLFQAIFLRARIGLSYDLPEALSERISKEEFCALLEKAEESSRGLLKLDPVEGEDAYLNCRFEVEEKVDELLSSDPDSPVPFAIRYWMTKKNVLSEDFGIAWKTPAEMNPNIRFS